MDAARDKRFDILECWLMLSDALEYDAVSEGWHILWIMVMENNYDVVKWLLDNHKNNMPYWSEILVYVTISDLDMYELLIGHGVTVDAEVWEANITPLHTSIYAYDIESIKFLLRSGYKVNSTNWSHETVMSFFLLNMDPNKEIFDLLVSYGATYEFPQIRGDNPAICAIMSLNHYYYLEIRDVKIPTDFYRYVKHIETLKVLFNRGYKIPSQYLDERLSMVKNNYNEEFTSMLELMRC